VSQRRRSRRPEANDHRQENRTERQEERDERRIARRTEQADVERATGAFGHLIQRAPAEGCRDRCGGQRMTKHVGHR
jgi:hypothetical protein